MHAVKQSGYSSSSGVDICDVCSQDVFPGAAGFVEPQWKSSVLLVTIPGSLLHTGVFSHSEQKTKLNIV